MRQITQSFLLTCFLALLSQPALAGDDEISIVGGVAYNLKSSEFTVGNKPFTPEFTTLDWSLIAAYKSFYVKGSFDQSIKDHIQINNTPGNSGQPDNSGLILGREDISITLGYRVLDSLSLFAGYTSGETSGITTGSINAQGGGVVTFQTTGISFKQEGSFIGASYSYFLQDSGSFSFSMAYANLDGDIVFNNSETDLTTGTTTISVNNITGTSTGASYAITWTDQFSEDMLYNIALKSVRYKFDGPAPVAPDFEDNDFDDNYNILSIGFSKYF